MSVIDSMTMSAILRSDRVRRGQMKIFGWCAILNRRSIANLGIIFMNRLRGRAVQQTSQLERVWGVSFWVEGRPKIGSHQRPLASPRCPHVQKCAILSRHPTPGWSRLTSWPKETYAALPHAFVCSSGLKEPYESSSLRWRSHGKGCAISSKARAVFLLFT